MLTNAQPTNPIGRDEVRSRDSSGVDQYRVICEFRTESSNIRIFFLSQQPDNSIEIERVMLTQILVRIVHPISIRTQLHEQVSESLGQVDVFRRPCGWQIADREQRADLRIVEDVKLFEIETIAASDDQPLKRIERRIEVKESGQ